MLGEALGLAGRGTPGRRGRLFLPPKAALRALTATN
jgi:hypothetical protein